MATLGKFDLAQFCWYAMKITLNHGALNGKISGSVATARKGGQRHGELALMMDHM
ncbi:hypothetical protein [Pectobacterium cacticida]|uniref:hypothetical protein n=1 Tax=Pectobacterium cacticida TaxID=69221 RepID=UPI0039874F82